MGAPKNSPTNQPSTLTTAPATNLNVNVSFNLTGLDPLLRLFQGFDSKLDQLISLGGTILMTEKEALDVMDKVDATTTKMGATQQADADLLQKISDEIDQLKNTAGVPASVASRLGALAGTLQGLSDNGDAQAVILQGILAKGQPPVPTAPVPEPVPEPTPV